MEEYIINLLGKNHKNTIELLKSKKDEPYGLYTHKGKIYLLKNGTDISWDELSLMEQTNVYNQILTNNYKVNKSLQ